MILTTKQRAQRILASLTSVNEDLLALADDVGHSINFRDLTSLDTGTEFLRSYSQKLNTFQALSEEIAVMIRERQGIATEDTPGNRAGTPTNPRDPFLADRAPHFLSEDFTFTKPIGFVLRGQAFKGISTWREAYVTVCRELARLNPARFATLPEHPTFLTQQNHRWFSRSQGKPTQWHRVDDGIYVYVNLSANDTCERIRQLLREFSVSETDMKIYLQREQSAEIVA